MTNPIRKACDYMGGAATLARRLGVSAQAVCFWRDGKRAMPVQYCTRIEALTNAVVTRQQLRPDDWREIWPELAGANDSTPAPLAAGGAHA